MPLHWKFDSKAKLVAVVLTGEVRPPDVEAYLAAVEGAGALEYRKLFDLTGSQSTMDGDDLLALGARIRAFHDRPAGALAIVVRPEHSERLARLFGMLAVAKRPLRIFEKRDAAERWLKALP